MRLELNGTSAHQATINEIQSAAVLRQGSTAQSDATVLAAVHLLYMDGILRLTTGKYSSDALWDSLKRPIAILNLLSRRGLIGYQPNDPRTRKQPIPTPGCAAEDGSELTTYALYNNLIVGYLTAKNFSATRAQRERECRRSYRNQPLDQNPLFAVLQHYCRSDQVEEYRIWAISNAEQLLEKAPEPPDLIVSFTLALLTDSARQRGQPPQALKALKKKRDALFLVALREWKTAPPAYKKILAPNLVGLTASTAGQQDGFTPLPSIEFYLTDVQAQVIKATHFTTQLRDGDSTLLFKQPEQLKPQIGQTLGEARADPWLKAAAQDFAAALKRYADAKHMSDDERTSLYQAVRNSLPPEAISPVLKSGFLSPLLSWVKSDRLIYAICITFATFCAFGVWLLGRWLEIQLCEWKALFTSFYRIEADRIAARRKPS
jgi:hypothetical protein